MKPIVLLLILVLSCQAGPDRKSDAELRELASLAHSELSDEEHSWADEARKKLLSDVESFTAEDRFRLTQWILQPEPGSYLHIDAVKEIALSEAAGQILSSEQKQSLLELLLKFQLGEASTDSPYYYDRAKYAWLCRLTVEVASKLESGPPIVPNEPPEVGPPEAKTLLAKPIWHPGRLSSETTQWISGDDWVAWENELISSDPDLPGGTALSLVDGKNMSVPTDAKVWRQDMVFGDLIIAPGSVWNRKTGKIRQLWEYHEGLERYNHYSASETKLYQFFQPPPHYFGESILYAETQNVKHKLHELNMASPPEKVEEIPLPFGNAPADSFRGALEGVLPSGGLVVSLTGDVFATSQPIRKRVFASTGRDRKKFEEFMTVEIGTEIRVLPGPKERLLLIFHPPELTFDIAVQIPERVVFFQFPEKNYFLGFRRSDESPQLNPAWPLEPYGAPMWKLPETLDTPPADELHQCQVMALGSDLYLFLSRRKPGREIIPRFELWRFRPGDPKPRRAPIQLDLTDQIRANLKGDESNWRDLEFVIHRSKDYWAIASPGGIWKLDAARVEEALKESSGR